MSSLTCVMDTAKIIDGPKKGLVGGWKCRIVRNLEGPEMVKLRGKS